MTAPTRTLEALAISSVQPEEVRWLWFGRIPMGKLTMLDGDPGLGKSFITLDLAARVSTGRPMPLETTPSGPPVAVILLSAEDGLADTIRPRLDALQADVKLVHAVTGVVDTNGEEQGVTFPIDIGGLQRLVEQHDARLVIVDPLMAFIGDNVNTKVDHDVRRLLAPLSRLAETTGAAVVVVRHLNKSSATSAVYRGGGSIAFIGAARAGLLVARDPDDEDKRVLAGTKMNLAPMPPSLSFSIGAPDSGGAVVHWHGETGHRADDLVTPDEELQAAGDLGEFLRELLRVPRTFPEVRKKCRDAGFAVSDRTLSRARKKLGVTVTRQEFAGVTSWSLGNGHSGHIPDTSRMTDMVQYDDPDEAVREAKQETAPPDIANLTDPDEIVRLLAEEARAAKGANP